MMTTIDRKQAPPHAKNGLRIAIIVALVIAAFLLLYLPGWGKYGPAPSFTGKIISIVPASSQEKAHDSTLLGTVLLRGSDGYQLRLQTYHATGNGCLGQYTLHLSDIQVGQEVTVRYWPDTPETSSNPHNGHAVYIGNRC